MRRPISTAFLLCAGLVSNILSAQQAQWLTASPANWVLNPTTPVDVLCARDPEHVYVARLDAIAYTYNQPMGSVTLSRQGADGTVLWSVSLGDTVQVESIASDADGNVVLGGRYFRRLLVDGDPVLTYPADHVSEGSILCSWNEEGELLWQQEVSGAGFDDVSVASIALDPQGRFWAALSTFFSAEIVRLDADGAQVESRSLVESKTVGNISFDPWGGLYVAGAAGSPGMTVNGTDYPITENYAFFVTRMNAAGNAQWLHYAHDITFQRPRVQADQGGHAYLIGAHYDPLSWGSIAFAQPLWSTAFFLTRLDSLGNFEWGVAPPQIQFSGQFILGRGNALGVDGEGNAYVLGDVNGHLDWGSGVHTGAGTITDASVALISFDDAGTPRWAVQDANLFTHLMYDVAVATDGVSHLVGITSEPFTLGPFTVDPVNARGTVVARIDPEISTDVFDPARPDQELTACPSLFHHGFRLISPARTDTCKVQVLLLDGTGRVVQQANHLDGDLGIGLAPGAYSVHVRMAEHTFRTRVVKQ